MSRLHLDAELEHESCLIHLKNRSSHADDSEQVLKVILLIESDDTDASLFGLVATSRDINARVHVVKDVTQARACLEGKGMYEDRREYPLPSLLVLGQALDSTALEFLHWLRSHNEFRTLPILAWPAEGFNGQIEKLQEAGVSHHVVKSPSTAPLRAAIKMMLTRTA